ncbi:MAG: NAD(P)-binding domain-containing protein [Flavobacteriales bacterium]|nr:NAD(P)-binding domain-containing protein [Flavobacteriales bacterium]NCG29038.1 NAD(P)-binding domain-containing protein [Bacteroidota bacterium]MBT3962666.1 NAD(P)-binding domain-containing protein [Flavobacteriales bacterium]MBT4705056.1 NAD(P)-binding domain-containing protein [Flavobacteriales bacterium]MBT4930076.1 NAD(P)-binding domain-containing protein [Flavobacteriales bacterium]
MEIGVIGAGTMGSGIAQVAAQNGHRVWLFDTNEDALTKSQASLKKIMSRLVEKERITEEQASQTIENVQTCSEFDSFRHCGFVIEAVVENLDVKKEVFQSLEAQVDESCILATNTSSLSVASIAATCKVPSRVVGVHFFNPAPLMPLVEIVPAVQTASAILEQAKTLVDSWKKVTVIAKDTPGFIVNRVARPFYGEAIRMYEEGVAEMSTIDYAMKEVGKFRMGPFELMDYIGNDINYAVTESVWTAFYYDPRYRPSFTQKRMTEAGYLGRKSGRGYYDYSDGATKPPADTNPAVLEAIHWRILIMLINEAADALHLGIASRDDIDLAMTKGVNYPKGLLKWADEIGIQKILDGLDKLYLAYHEERYRASVLLRQYAAFNRTFY